MGGAEAADPSLRNGTLSECRHNQNNFPHSTTHGPDLRIRNVRLRLAANLPLYQTSSSAKSAFRARGRFDPRLEMKLRAWLIMTMVFIAYLMLFLPHLVAEETPISASTPAEQLSIPLADQIKIKESETKEAASSANPMMMGGPGGGSGMGQGPGYAALWVPQQKVDGTNQQLGTLRQDLNLGFPLWIDGPDRLMLTGGIASLNFLGDRFQLKDSMRTLPDQFWNIRLGLMYMHRFENGWQGMFMANIGSASDQPFQSTREMQLSTIGSLRVPSGERNAWLFSVMYSPTNELRFPIPGVAFQWNPSDAFQMSLGIPFSFRWKPTPDTYWQASYMPLRNINTEFGWKIHDGPVTVFGGFSWANESYFLADRIDSQERLFLYSKNLGGGLKYQLLQRLQLELSGGYAFDRFLFTGNRYQDNSNDRLGLGSGPFGRLAFRLKF
jgi:hypothetical protein